jgi:acetyltransferase
MFGAGGTMVEVLKDNAVALPPLTTLLAERLISRTRVSKLLEPFRNRPAVDRKAMIDVLLRVSEMLCELPHIREIDINPLLAGPDGVMAVDARIGVGRPASGAQPYDHVAIAPYPRHLVETGYLADGTPLTIRPIRPEDAESEQAFVKGLSSEAKRFRFMQSIEELTPQMLAQFTQIDYRREMALVAVTGEEGREAQQGVARYIINPDGRTCEFAIVVGDAKRNMGIGSRLMQALFAAARRHGLKVMEGEVLAENHAMLRLMADLGFTAATSPDDPGIVNVEFWL